VVIDKPPGLLVHRSAIAADVSDNALHVLSAQLGRPVYPAHRLDRPTSGVLVFALDPETLRQVNAQFADHQVQKSYVAIVRGYIEEDGRLEYALSGRDTDKKKSAVTTWQRLATAELPSAVGRYSTARYSLVELSPTTGRWHQLRRHCAHLRHPIIGDTSHGDGAHNRFFKGDLDVNGLLLLAQSLTLEHPVSAAPLTFVAPLESRFLAAFNALGWETPLAGPIAGERGGSV
jgi:tRNA pseudouridine65 synthase